MVGAPEQCIEGTYFDTDSAIHTQRVVDVEAVELLGKAGLATFTSWWALILVALDEDAPNRTLPRTEHADRAVLFLECNDTTGSGCLVGLLVRILNGLALLEQV